MKTPKLPCLLNFTVLFAVAGLCSSPASGQIGPNIPTVSIRGSGATPEYCPPNADCVGLNFLLTRTGPGLDNSLQVMVGYSGTATAGADYVELPSLVTFQAGQDRVAIFSAAIDDTLQEGDETVVARLLPGSISPANQYTVSTSNGVATVTILDNDSVRVPPLVSLELVDPDAGETLIYQNAIFWAEFRARREGSVTNELDVFLGAPQGTAKLGEDYWLAGVSNGAIHFPAGVAAVTVRLYPIDDNIFEGNETALFKLVAPPAGTPASGQYEIDPAHSSVATVIHDNDEPILPGVRIEASSPIAEESSFPYRRLPLRGRFTISRSGPTNGETRVFVLIGGTATPGVDYPSLPWLVTIPVGASRVDLEVVATPDDLPEPMETVEATLSECPPLTDPPLGMPCYGANIDPAHSSARIFIRDDGITTASLEITAPRNGAVFPEGVSIAIAATALDLAGAITHVDFFDGNSKIGESSIYFFREPDPGTPIYHEFEWRGASAGAHALTARAVDAGGNAVTSAPVNIKVGSEPPLVPIVSIRASVPDTLEPLCDPAICDAPTPAPGVFSVSRRGGDLTLPLTVFLRYGGSALPGADYESLPDWVQIPSGKESVDLFVEAAFDQLIEGDESVVAALQPDPSMGPIARYQIDPARASARVTIHDRTPPALPLVSITATDAFAREGSSNANPNTATFVVTRSGPTNELLVVRFGVGGTASNGVDYAALASPVTIPAGHRAARLIVNPIDDNRPEPIESIVITLLEDDASAPRYTLGTPRRAAAVLVDNDCPKPHCVRLPDGRFNLCVPSDVAQCFRVECTHDFKTWTPLGIVPVNEGDAQFVDPDADTATRRFYRLIPIACDPEPML